MPRLSVARSAPWAFFWSCLLVACQPPGGLAPATPVVGPTTAPAAGGESLHQGGVVFLKPPAGGFAVGGTWVPEPGMAGQADVALTLVLADGKALPVTLDRASGAFSVTHLPAAGRAPLVALHVVAGGFRGYVAHASGGEARRAWWRPTLDQAYDLGELRAGVAGATATRNPLALLDADADGQPDELDLDDDNDGLVDAQDPIDLADGVPDDHDPAWTR